MAVVIDFRPAATLMSRSIRSSMIHLNTEGVNDLHLNCFRVLYEPPLPVPFVENPMNVINLLTFLPGSVSGGRSSIWESNQLATFGDEIPLEKSYDVLRRLLNWIAVGSEMDLTKSPLASLSPGRVRLFLCGSRNNRSDMLWLAFFSRHRDLSDILMLRGHLLLSPQVGNSHSGFGPFREVPIDQSSKRYAGKYFTYAEGSEGKP
jgi:hypothetical protein